MVRALTGVVTAVSVLLASAGCASPTRSTVPHPPSRTQMAELWIDPTNQPRDLRAGPGTVRPPAADVAYEVLERDTRGFSITYRVKDARGAEWNVKIGPEAQTEVVASRILWALGYHQLPSHFVERWIAVQDGRGQVLGGARFRPREDGLDGKGTWAWRANPFVGTRPYHGLLTLLALINSTDLKDDNNEVYEVEHPRARGPRRLFVVKDLGASLGETGRVDPRRGFIDGFEREAFLVGRDGEWVRFAFRGRHQDLLRRIPVADLRWMCERVLALTDREWRAVFRAGNYDAATSARYVARLRQKAREGLALR